MKKTRTEDQEDVKSANRIMQKIMQGKEKLYSEKHLLKKLIKIANQRTHF